MPVWPVTNVMSVGADAVRKTSDAARSRPLRHAHVVPNASSDTRYAPSYDSGHTPFGTNAPPVMN
jgi:hypothetical protein